VSRPLLTDFSREGIEDWLDALNKDEEEDGE